MSKIEDLTLTDTLQDGNLFVVWNGGTRSVRVENAATYFQGKISGNFQPKNTMLTNLAQLGSSGVASQYIVITGLNTVAAITGANLLTNIGGQPVNPFLTSIASLGATAVADRMIYTTAANTAALTAITSFARTLLDDADAAAARTTLGVQPLDATLTALAGLTVASGDYIEATGADTFQTRNLFPVASATDIAAVGATINTAGKFVGRLVWDSTNNRMLRASGTAAADPWHVVDGSATVTPS